MGRSRQVLDQVECHEKFDAASLTELCRSVAHGKEDNTQSRNEEVVVRNLLGTVDVGLSLDCC